MLDTAHPFLHLTFLSNLDLTTLPHISSLGEEFRAAARSLGPRYFCAADWGPHLPVAAD